MELILELRKRVHFARHAKGDANIARIALDCLDLTTLSGDETTADIHKFCATAKANRVASVCIYPPYIADAKTVIRDADITIATVINFPYGSKRTLSDEISTAETTAEDVAMALASGAKQIDIVLPYEDYKVGNTDYCQGLLESCRNACGEDVTMKVILETAAFDNELQLRRACKFAVKYGADCLKTSTGKHENGGATLEVAAILLQEALHAPRQIGVKISGGIKTVDDCAQYIELATMIMGKDIVKPQTFRIGASSVLNELVETCKLENPEIHFGQRRLSR